MRELRTSLFALLFVACLSACHGGGAVPGGGLPQTAAHSNTARSNALLASPARLWFSSCVTCGIAMIQPKEVDVYVYTLAGTLLHSFTFGGGTTGAEPGLDLTSPDQRHVYVTMVSGADNYVADIDTQTYGLRYYHIPLPEAQGQILALLISPDGSRLYVPTTANLYVINTVTRTIAGTVAGQVAFATLTPDGKTLFGVTSKGLTAIYTATLTKSVFAPNPGALAMAATSSNLYVGTTNGVKVYDIGTCAPVKTILSSLVQRLVADPVIQRLYAWISGPSSNYAVAVNTSTQSAVKTFPNVFQGPFLDAVSHRIYTIDLPGNVCSYAPPLYTKSCAFTTNSAIPWDIAVTH